MISSEIFAKEAHIDKLSILTTHKLARELLGREDRFLTASDGEKEYVVESYQLAKTHANSDDFVTHIQLNLKEYGGNVIR